MVAVAFLIVLGFYSFSPDVGGSQKAGIVNMPRTVLIGGTTVSVEIVDTDETRARGLSRHKPLAPNEGMLFIFDEPGFYSFWMKDMDYAIDMIWIGEDLKIVYIKENASPESYPETFKPTSKAKYVLEVNAGFAKEYSLKVGDTITLN